MVSFKFDGKAVRQYMIDKGLQFSTVAIGVYGNNDNSNRQLRERLRVGSTLVPTADKLAKALGLTLGELGELKIDLKGFLWMIEDTNNAAEPIQTFPFFDKVNEKVREFHKGNSHSTIEIMETKNGFEINSVNDNSEAQRLLITLLKKKQCDLISHSLKNYEIVLIQASIDEIKYGMSSKVKFNNASLPIDKGNVLIKVRCQIIKNNKITYYSSIYFDNYYEFNSALNKFLIKDKTQYQLEITNASEENDSIYFFLFQPNCHLKRVTISKVLPKKDVEYIAPMSIFERKGILKSLGENNVTPLSRLIPRGEKLDRLIKKHSEKTELIQFENLLKGAEI